LSNPEDWTYNRSIVYREADAWYFSLDN